MRVVDAYNLFSSEVIACHLRGAQPPITTHGDFRVVTSDALFFPQHAHSKRPGAEFRNFLTERSPRPDSADRYLSETAPERFDRIDPTEALYAHGYNICRRLGRSRFRFPANAETALNGLTVSIPTLHPL